MMNALKENSQRAVPMKAPVKLIDDKDWEEVDNIFQKFGLPIHHNMEILELKKVLQVWKLQLYFHKAQKEADTVLLS